MQTSILTFLFLLLTCGTTRSSPTNQLDRFNEDNVVVVLPTRHWTVKDLSKIALSCLHTNEDFPRGSKLSPTFTVFPMDMDKMCVVTYFQSFGRPCWEVTIGYDGKVKQISKAIALEGRSWRAPEPLSLQLEAPKEGGIFTIICTNTSEQPIVLDGTVLIPSVMCRLFDRFDVSLPEIAESLEGRDSMSESSFALQPGHSVTINCHFPNAIRKQLTNGPYRLFFCYDSRRTAQHGIWRGSVCSKEIAYSGTVR